MDCKISTGKIRYKVLKTLACHKDMKKNIPENWSTSSAEFQSSIEFKGNATKK